MVEYKLHDVVTMKKPHACGSNEWEIRRIGMEMRIRCVGCEHQVVMLRNDFNKRVRKVLYSTDGEQTTDQ